MLQLLGLSGRIGRGRWWLVQFICVVLLLVTNIPVLLDSFGAITEALERKFAPEDAQIYIQATTQDATMQWLPLTLLGTVITYWLFTTSTVQRLHDRGSSGWRVLFAFVPNIFSTYLTFFSDVAEPSDFDMVAILLGYGGGLFAMIWCIVECGMLRGQDVANEYGSTPDAVRDRAAMLDELRAMGGNPDVDEKPRLFAPSEGEPVFGRR